MTGRRRSGRKVHDDRGREVEPLRPSSAADLPKDSPQAQLVGRLACNDFTIAGPRAVGAAVTLVIVYFIALGVVDWLSLPDWVGSTIGYALFAAGGIVAKWLFWTGAAKQIAMTAVRRGLCGSCGYSLEALAPEPDGCVLCPECGAAWRQGRVTRPHWKGVPFIEREEKRAWWRFPPAHRFAADDRGGLADVLDLGLTRVVGITLDEREAIRRDLRDCGRGSRIAVMVLFVAPAALLMLGAITSGDMFLALSGAVLSLLVGLGAWIVHRSFGYIPRRIFCTILKRHGIMPCCGQRMSGQVDEWGCFTCSRCGAGWRKIDAG